MRHIIKNKNIIKTFILISIIPVLFCGCSLIEGEKSLFSRFRNSENINLNDQLETTEEIIATNEISAVNDSFNTEEGTPVPTIEPTPVVQHIQLWVPPQFDTTQDTQAGKALADAISAYTKNHPNVTISIRVKASSGDSSMVNTIIAADHVAKDVLPSLALMSRSDMETSVQRNMLKPITTDVFTDSNSWYNYARQSAVIDNTVYGIPVLGDALVLTYRNSKIGAELGDWKDILARGLPIGFAPSSSSSLFPTFIYLSQGGKLSNDQGQPYLDQQKLTDTLNFFLNGGQNGAFPPSIAQLVDQAQVWQRFNDGTMSIIVTPFSSYRHYQTPEITMHPLPLQEESSSYPMVSTWNLVMLEDNQNLQGIALEFAEYLCDIPINDAFSYSAGYLPVRNSEHESWINDPEDEIIKNICEKAILIPGNSLTSKIYPILNNAVTQVIKNQATPDDAAKEAIANLN